MATFQVFNADGALKSVGATGATGATGGSSVGEHVIAYNTTTQSLTTATWTAMVLDAEDADTDAFHDNATNNPRFTVPAGKAGGYQISGHVDFASNATGIRGIHIYLNGVVGNSLSQFFMAASGSGTLASVSGFVRLAVGDYVEAFIYQSSGGALNTGSATRGFANQFEMVRVCE